MRGNRDLEIIYSPPFFYGCTHSMQKFLGQGSNLHHSSDNARSLTHWATRELQQNILYNRFLLIFASQTKQQRASLCICLHTFMWKYPWMNYYKRNVKDFKSPFPISSFTGEDWDPKRWRCLPKFTKLPPIRVGFPDKTQDTQNLKFRLTNNFLYNYITCNIWDILKIYALFIWNSNLTRYPVFSFANPSNSTAKVGVEFKSLDYLSHSFSLYDMAMSSKHSANKWSRVNIAHQ